MISISSSVIDEESFVRKILSAPNGGGEGYAYEAGPKTKKTYFGNLDYNVFNSIEPDLNETTTRDCGT
jgi:hypothetical protein